MSILKIKDIMVSGWIATLDPEDSLIHAAKLFGQYNYDGFPVIEKDKTLVGIVTAYDMVSDKVFMHISGMEEILEKMEENEAHKSDLKEHFNKIDFAKVKEIMNTDPLTVKPEMSMRELANEFIKHHRVNPIPVVDDNNKLVGVVSRYDLIRFLDDEYLDKVLIASGHKTIFSK